jgi:hypothetical protein
VCVDNIRNRLRKIDFYYWIQPTTIQLPQFSQAHEKVPCPYVLMQNSAPPPPEADPVDERERVVANIVSNAPLQALRNLLETHKTCAPMLSCVLVNLTRLMCNNEVMGKDGDPEEIRLHVTSTLAVMKRHPTHAALQCIAMLLLGQLITTCKNYYPISETLFDEGAVALILKAMEMHSEVHGDALYLLRLLMDYDEETFDARLSPIERKVAVELTVSALVKALSTPDGCSEEGLVVDATRLLGTLGIPWEADIHLKNFTHGLVQALQTPELCDFVDTVIDLLTIVAKSREGRDVIAEIPHWAEIIQKVTSDSPCKFIDRSIVRFTTSLIRQPAYETRKRKRDASSSST